MSYARSTLHLLKLLWVSAAIRILRWCRPDKVLGPSAPPPYTPFTIQPLDDFGDPWCGLDPIPAYLGPGEPVEDGKTSDAVVYAPHKARQDATMPRFVRLLVNGREIARSLPNSTAERVKRGQPVIFQHPISFGN